MWHAQNIACGKQRENRFIRKEIEHMRIKLYSYHYIRIKKLVKYRQVCIRDSTYTILFEKMPRCYHIMLNNYSDQPVCVVIVMNTRVLKIQPKRSLALFT